MIMIKTVYILQAGIIKGVISLDVIRFEYSIMTHAV